jgi:hypothetical protein
LKVCQGTTLPARQTATHEKCFVWRILYLLWQIGGKLVPVFASVLPDMRRQPAGAACRFHHADTVPLFGFALLYFTLSCRTAPAMVER